MRPAFAADRRERGYAMEAGDCDDFDASVWEETRAFPDVDEDGFGAGVEVWLCAGASLPAGYVDNDEDCNDGLDSLYQLLPGYVDNDLDGHGAGNLLWVCSGGSLTSGFVTNADDCDDQNPQLTTWRFTSYDRDQDGYPESAAVQTCEGTATGPTQWQAPACDAFTPCPNGTQCDLDDRVCQPDEVDCDDDDASVFVEKVIFVDVDGDGHGSDASERRCVGEHPPEGWSFSSDDCDDTPVVGVSRHEWGSRYVDQDGDGYTAGGLVEVCVGVADPTGYTGDSLGEDCDDENPAVFEESFGYPDLDGDGLSGEGRVVCSNGALPANFSAVKNGHDCDDSSNTVPAFTCEDLPDACGIIADGCPPPGTYCGPCPGKSDAGFEASAADAGSSRDDRDLENSDSEDQEPDAPEPNASKNPPSPAPDAAGGCFGNQMPNRFVEQNWPVCLLALVVLLRRRKRAEYC